MATITKDIDDSILIDLVKAKLHRSNLPAEDAPIEDYVSALQAWLDNEIDPFVIDQDPQIISAKENLDNVVNKIETQKGIRIQPGLDKIK